MILNIYMTTALSKVFQHLQNFCEGHQKFKALNVEVAKIITIPNGIKTKKIFRDNSDILWEKEDERKILQTMIKNRLRLECKSFQVLLGQNFCRRTTIKLFQTKTTSEKLLNRTF